MLSADKMYFEFVHWGGSPKRVLEKSPSLSDVFVNKCISLDKYVRSDDPIFEKMLRNGETSWLLMPLSQDTNVLIASALVQQNAKRPIWHFIAIVIKQREFENFKTVKCLVGSILTLLSGKWWEYEEGERQKIALLIGDNLCPENVQTALSDLYSKSIHSAAGTTVAYNPSCIETDWRYVINTTGRIINKSRVTSGADCSAPHKDIAQPRRVGDSDRNRQMRDTRTEVKVKSPSRLPVLPILAVLCVVILLAVTFVTIGRDGKIVSADNNANEYSSHDGKPKSPLARRKPETAEDLRTYILRKTGGFIKINYNAQETIGYDDTWRLPKLNRVIPLCRREIDVRIAVNAVMKTDLSKIQILQKSKDFEVGIPASRLVDYKRESKSLTAVPKCVGFFRRKGLTDAEKNKILAQKLNPADCSFENKTLQMAAYEDAQNKIREIAADRVQDPKHISFFVIPNRFNNN